MLPVVLQFIGSLAAFIGAVLMALRMRRQAGPVFLAVGLGILLILSLWRLFGVI